MREGGIQTEALLQEVDGLCREMRRELGWLGGFGNVEQRSDLVLELVPRR